MILKRSDKLIAIIGVIILIVAGIGIFIYISSEGESENDQGHGNKNKFMVEWIEEDQKVTVNGWAGRTGAYSETISNTIFKEPVSVLLNVELRIIWEDSHITGRFLRRGPIKVGQDSLSAEFTYSGETKMIPSHTGMGNKSEQFTIYDKPSDEVLEDVDNYNDAVQMIIEDYMNMDSASIDVKVMIKPGEKFALFRLLLLARYVMDKGESFDLEITYTYCYPLIKQIDDNDEEPPTELNPSGDRFSYSMMCLPGML